MKAFEYVSAESWDAAATFLAEQKAAIGSGPQPPSAVVAKAGGIDLLDRLKERIATPDVVLTIHGLRDEKKLIREESGGIVISALTRMAEVAAHPLIREKLPALATACNDAATPQIRNVATIGGNLAQKPRCWYYRSHDFHCLKKGGDTCFAVNGDNRYHAILGAGACHIVHPSNAAIPLLALNASLRLVRTNAGKLENRTVKLDDFFRVPSNPQDDENVLAPGELIHEIEIPASSAGPRSGYLEFREKKSFDWPLVACAANLNDPANPRIVLGAVAPIPWRLAKVEKLLAGKEVNDAALAASGRAALEGAKPMTHNGYKLQLVPVAVERALRLALGQAEVPA